MRRRSLIIIAVVLAFLFVTGWLAPGMKTAEAEPVPVDVQLADIRGQLYVQRVQLENNTQAIEALEDLVAELEAQDARFVRRINRIENRVNRIQHRGR